MEENLDDVVEQLKDNITNFRGAPISDANRDVRILRKRTNMKPLIDSGKLLKSIKKTKKGISINKYGDYVDRGWTFKKGWNKGNDGFYAPANKSGITKQLFKVAGIRVPPRPWIKYTPRARAFNTIFRNFMKALKTPRRTISVRKVKI